MMEEVVNRWMVEISVSDSHSIRVLLTHLSLVVKRAAQQPL